MDINAFRDYHRKTRSENRSKPQGKKGKTNFKERSLTFARLLNEQSAFHAIASALKIPSLTFQPRLPLIPHPLLLGRPYLPRVPTLPLYGTYPFAPSLPLPPSSPSRYHSLVSSPSLQLIPSLFVQLLRYVSPASSERTSAGPPAAVPPEDLLGLRADHLRLHCAASVHLLKRGLASHSSPPLFHRFVFSLLSIPLRPPLRLPFIPKEKRRRRKQKKKKKKRITIIIRNPQSTTNSTHYPQFSFHLHTHFLHRVWLATSPAPPP